MAKIKTVIHVHADDSHDSSASIEDLLDAARRERVGLWTAWRIALETVTAGPAPGFGRNFRNAQPLRIASAPS